MPTVSSWALMLLVPLLFGVSGCSDFTAEHRLYAGAQWPAGPNQYRFDRAPLDGNTDLGEDARYIDRLLRVQLQQSLERRGFEQVDANPTLLVDFALSELPGEVFTASLTPGSVRDSWDRDTVYGRDLPDVADSSDHRVAKAGFSSHLRISVLVRDAARRRLIWEGLASQTLPEKRPRRFESIVRKMVDRIVAGLPAPD